MPSLIRALLLLFAFPLVAWGAVPPGAIVPTPAQSLPPSTLYQEPFTGTYVDMGTFNGAVAGLYSSDMNATCTLTYGVTASSSSFAVYCPNAGGAFGFSVATESACAQGTWNGTACIVPASCPSGYNEPSGDPYCEPNPPPTCPSYNTQGVVDWAQPGTNGIGTMMGGPSNAQGQLSCVDGCEFASGVPLNGRASFFATGNSCAPEANPPPTKNTPCNGTVGTVNGTAVCLASPPATGTGQAASLSGAPAPSSSVPAAGPSWSVVPWPSGSAPTSNGSATLDNVTGGSIGQSVGNTTGGGSVGSSSTGSSTTKNSDGSTSNTSTTTTCTNGVCTTTSSTTNTPAPPASSTSTASPPPNPPSSPASSVTKVQMPGGFASDPGGAWNTDTVGLPRSNPFTVPATPVIDLPGNAGSCGVLQLPFGNTTMTVNPCPILDAVRPVLDWSVMASAVLGAMFMVLGLRGGDKD